MRTWTYQINEVFKGEVSATDVKDAIKQAIDIYYSKMKNVEVLDFQAMYLTVKIK